MFIEQYKTIFDIGDYEENKNGITQAAEPITANQYNVVDRIAHVISANGKQGFFSLRFNDLAVGDIIEFECEFRSISGVLPKVGIDEMNGSINNNKITFTSKKQGEWETLTGRYIVENSTYSKGDHRISFGLFTVDIGEYYVRNIKVKCHRNSAENPGVVVTGSANGAEYIKNPDGTLICYATVTIVGVANTNVSKTILYAMPFVDHPAKFANIEQVSGNDNYTVRNLSFRRGSLAGGSLVINTDVSQTYTVNVMAIGRWK